MSGDRFETGSISVDASSSPITIRNATGTISLDRTTGRLSLASAHLTLRGRIGVETSVPILFGSDDLTVTTSRSTVLDGTVVAFTQRLGEATLHCRIHADANRFVIETGATKVKDSLLRLLPFDGDVESTGHWRMLRIAYCGAHSQSLLSQSALVPLSRDTNETSWWCTALTNRSGEGVVLGFGRAMKFAGAFKVKGSQLRAFNFAEHANADGETVWSEPLFVAFGDIVEQLTRYADFVSREMRARDVLPPPFGWSSWLHFETEYDENTVRENAEELSRWFEGSRHRPTIQMDHGWERRVRRHRPETTWQPRPDFTTAMPALIQYLNGLNVHAGLWVVPFAINAGTPDLERHLRYVVRDADGKPKKIGGTNAWCIDPTHPEGEALLRSLFQRFTDWGVTYFKLEYLRALLAPEPDDAGDGFDAVRVHHRPLTRVEVYRHGLSIIRDVAGESAYLLGCGAPALPGAGLVDAHRVGGDMAATWENSDGTGVKPCSRNAAMNFFWNRRTWRNDPDVLPALAEDDRLFRFWATTVALIGGSAMISADLPQLSRARKEWFSRLLPPFGATAAPSSLGADGVQEWLLRMQTSSERYFVVGLFNPSDVEKAYRLDAMNLPWGESQPNCVIWDFWNERAIDTRSPIAIGPHDAALLAVRRETGSPQLCGSSLHYTMGALELTSWQWRPDTNELQWELSDLRRRGDLWFRVPDAFRYAEPPGDLIENEGSRLRVRVTESSHRKVTLRFDPGPHRT